MHKRAFESYSLKEKYGDEQVFVVRSDLFSSLEPGLTLEKEDSIAAITMRYDKEGKFIMRYDAENNPAFLQIIPYVIIKNKAGQYFAYERLEDSTEDRLRHQISIGFGGHINPCDGPTLFMFRGMMRELEEELELTYSDPLQYIGKVKDFSAGLSDHIGFVFELEVEDADIKEKEKHRGFWMTKQDLKDKYFTLETWSRHIADYLCER